MDILRSMVKMVILGGYFALLTVGMLVFIALAVMAVYELWESFSHFFVNDDAIALVVKLLHSFEFFFLAPIPILIILSYRNYILVLLPKNDKPVQPEKISPEHAERAFIGSLIGTIATFVLGYVIEETHGSDAAKQGLYLLGLLIVTLMVLVGFFHIVSKHIKH